MMCSYRQGIGFFSSFGTQTFQPLGMPRKRLQVLVFILLSLIFATQHSFSQNKLRTIVVFFTQNANTGAYTMLMDGFRSVLMKETDLSCNIKVEYLDIGRVSNDDYARNIVNLYNEKFSDTPIDLIIVIGPLGLKTLETYGLKAIENTPVISIENYGMTLDSVLYPLKENLLRIYLKYDHNKTIKTAFELFPDHKNVYLISGVSALDEYYMKSVRSKIKDYGEIRNIVLVSGISIDSTLQMVEKIPRDDLIIVINFRMDGNGNVFSTPEVVSMIANHSSAPVLSVYDDFPLRKGGIGGYLFSWTNVGEETAKAAMKVLKGFPVKDISINEKSFYQYIFNRQELKRWGLHKSKAIPSDSKFYNDDISFINKYKWYIVALFLFLISQTLGILYLIKLNRRQRQVLIQKAEADALYRELIREDRLSKMVELTASLSHELNQPLTAILFTAQAGKRFLRSEKLDLKKAEEIFDNIIEDDKRAGGIITSVRSLMKFENRELENVNLTAVVEETLGIMHSDLIRYNIKLLCNFDSDPVFVFGDKIQLQQVLMNFIRNAMNALESNKPEDRTIEIKLQESKGSTTVSVADSGPGIDKTILNKLFKPFVTSSKKGFGIGLALSWSIIERHKGEIRAINLPRGGAEFSFILKKIKNA
jgi:signal transduction histidine kinase